MDTNQDNEFEPNASTHTTHSKDDAEATPAADEPTLSHTGWGPDAASPEASIKLFPPRKNLGTGRPSTAPEQPVSAAGLMAGRAARWHQQDNALLTRDAVKEWMTRFGLVLYAPRAQQLGVPAPSFVEAVLGHAVAAPEAAQMEVARILLAALVAEGAVVPLNLLGITGAAGTDMPDYVCSAAVFSFIFTLRGNKAWKTPPAISGAVKVSPLGLATYELLGNGPVSAYDLTTQLGKEVTEAAVRRALTELWAQLRVIPTVAADGSATLWELASARFTRQIKAGANAGQPTALSALISLYLGQAMAAEETEVETFLSPLAARSRIREVLHALLGARELETFAVGGKTLLHIAGEAPVLAAAAVDESSPATENATPTKDGSRIKKFAPTVGRTLGAGARTRPAGARPSKPPVGKPAYGKSAGPRRGGGSSRPSFDRAAGGDRERRPFQKPAFDKPWSERPARPASASGEERPPRREFMGGVETGGERPAAGPKRTFSKPGTFGRKRDDARPAYGRGAERPGGFREGHPERRPAGDRPAAGGFKRPFAPRPGAGADRGDGGERARPAFGKPAFGKPVFRRPEPGGTGAFRSKPRNDEGSAREGEAPRTIYRKFDAPRGAKPFTGKPFTGKPGGGRSFGSKPPAGRSFGAGPGGSDSERPRPFFDRSQRSFDGPRSPRTEDGSRLPRRDAGGFAARPQRSGGDRPFRSGPPRGAAAGGDERPRSPRPFKPSGPTSGPFAKFAGGNKKPFARAGGGSRPGASRPSGGASRGPRGAEGGFAPSKRKRPEGDE